MIKPDLTYLETISGGDKSFIISILEMFIGNTFPELENIKTQAAQQNWDELGNTVHKIKAPLQMMGVQQLSDLVVELEQMAKHKKNIDQIPQMVTELELMLNELRKGIDDFLG